MSVLTQQEFRELVEMVESWIKDHTAINPKRSPGVLNTMIWLAGEAELQGKSWHWVLENSSATDQARENWNTRTFSSLGRPGKHSVLVSPERARSHRIGRAQPRQANRKGPARWWYLVPPALPKEIDQLEIVL